jgi:hypothetical protein
VGEGDIERAGDSRREWEREDERMREREEREEYCARMNGDPLSCSCSFTLSSNLFESE